MSADLGQVDPSGASILDAEDPGDRRVLETLRADARIEFVDRWDEQVANLRRLRPLPEPAVLTEPKRWIYYPWRRSVVALLGPRAFRLARLDRNRNVITADEQEVLGALRIGIIGLSAGHAVAYTLAAQGLCRTLRLTDFDSLEVSNLNRVAASVFDVGLNKATIAARKIAELDPYLPVEVITSGISTDNIDVFLDGLDILVEECDSLDIKVTVREAARARRLPVLMATTDRGLVDIERYDLEPSRPLLHGLLPDIDTARLSDMPSREKVPHVLRILDAAQMSPRGAASLVEVGHTLSTWPQLAGDVALGATAIAEAVRRIGLRHDLPSGRVRIDIRKALDHVQELTTSDDRGHELSGEHARSSEPDEPHEAVAAAAVLAPSGGNAQPWRVETHADSVVISLAPEHTSTMDLGFRGSAVAVGAAAYNARIAAAARGVLGRVHFDERDESTPLRAVVELGDRGDPELAQLYRPMRRRETNRHYGQRAPLADDIAESLTTAAAREGGRARLLCGKGEMAQIARILADAERIRYLTPRLHAEMMSELRWPGDSPAESGIDVRSLELDSGELVTLDVLRRSDVMAQLAEWDAGAALGEDTLDRVTSSSALAVVCVKGNSLTEYARGGMAMEATWITAHHHGLNVQPVSPVFLYAHNDDDLYELSPTFTRSLRDLQSEFRKVSGIGLDESEVLVLRLFEGPEASIRSRRRVQDAASR